MKSLKVYTNILTDSILTKNSKIVLSYLISLYNKGIYMPSNKLISENTNINIQGITKAISFLKNNNYISYKLDKIVYPDKDNKNNTFIVTTRTIDLCKKTLKLISNNSYIEVSLCKNFNSIVLKYYLQKDLGCSEICKIMNITVKTFYNLKKLSQTVIIQSQKECQTVFSTPEYVEILLKIEEKKIYLESFYKESKEITKTISDISLYHYNQ